MQPSATAFTYGAASKVLSTAYYTVNTRVYDVWRNGRKFLMIKDPSIPSDSSGASGTSMVVVLNWLTELVVRVPRP